MVEVKNRAQFDSDNQELVATRIWIMNKDETIQQVNNLKKLKERAEEDIKTLEEEIQNTPELSEELKEFKKKQQELKLIEKLDQNKKDLEVAKSALKYTTEDLDNFLNAICGDLDAELGIGAEDGEK